jgi:hypothetical protein
VADGNAFDAAPDAYALFVEHYAEHYDAAAAAIYAGMRATDANELVSSEIVQRALERKREAVSQRNRRSEDLRQANIGEVEAIVKQIAKYEGDDIDLLKLKLKACDMLWRKYGAYVTRTRVELSRGKDVEGPRGLSAESVQVIKERFLGTPQLKAVSDKDGS